jgi:DNA-directed RNA polymerase specialized sigma24 family protein
MLSVLTDKPPISSKERLIPDFSHYPGVEEGVTVWDLMMDLERALALLPERWERAARMVFTEGLAQKEAARACGIDNNDVSRAVRWVRREMAEYVQE